MRENKKLKIIIGLIIILLIGIGIWGWISHLRERELISPSFKVAPQKETATLIINNAKGHPEKFEIETGEKESVFDLLKKTGVSIGYQKYDTGIFINSIGDVENNKKENKYWTYYVNGKSAKIGVGKKIVKPGDIIEWRYEKVNW